MQGKTKTSRACGKDSASKIEYLARRREGSGLAPSDKASRAKYFARWSRGNRVGFAEAKASRFPSGAVKITATAAPKAKLQLNIKSSRACGAAVAQRTHNPLVVGSNPSGPKFNKREHFSSFFYAKIWEGL